MLPLLSCLDCVFPFILFGSKLLQQLRHDMGDAFGPEGLQFQARSNQTKPEPAGRESVSEPEDEEKRAAAAAV